MKTRSPFLFLLLFGVFFLFSECTLTAADQSNLSTAKEVPIENDLAELFQRIRTVAPSALTKLDRLDRVKTLEKILTDLQTGIHPSSLGRIIQLCKTELKNDSNTSIYPGKLISGNSILYLRLDALTTASIRQLGDDCIAAARLAVKPDSAILDLRGAVGGNRALIPDVMSWFIPGIGKPETSYFQECPLLILVSHTTRGAPELLAAALAQRKRVVIGESTAGDLFSVKPVNAAGVMWLVPVIPDEYRDIPPLPFRPQITMTAGIPVTKKGVTPEERLTGDPALQRAVDLIEALRILTKPHPRKKKE